MMLEQQIKEAVNKKIASEGDFKVMSGCIPALLKAASFGKASKKNLINACIAAEFFYQALDHHYSSRKAGENDVILGDYYASIAVVYTSKTKDPVILDTFCRAIQDATKHDDDANGVAGRLAKIYAASSYVGAYLGGIKGSMLDDFYRQGEKQGLDAESIIAKN